MYSIDSALPGVCSIILGSSVYFRAGSAGRALESVSRSTGASAGCVLAAFVWFTGSVAGNIQLNVSISAHFDHSHRMVFLLRMTVN
ncbi:MAG: hypothetical protein AMXMBFR13_20850 [Phycisphaerae bacterium]